MVHRSGRHGANPRRLRLTVILSSEYWLLALGAAALSFGVLLAVGFVEGGTRAIRDNAGVIAVLGVTVVLLTAGFAIVAEAVGSLLGVAGIIAGASGVLSLVHGRRMATAERGRPSPASRFHVLMGLSGVVLAVLAIAAALLSR